MADKPLSSSSSSWKRRHWRPLTFLTILIVPSLAIAAWTFLTVTYSYSEGTRAGYAQKLSKKGWLCKTWEGELAMANLPGTMPQIFKFSVKNDSVARVIEKTLGKQVSLSYSEHRGIPTSCFGETQYFITNVRQIQP